MPETDQYLIPSLRTLPHEKLPLEFTWISDGSFSFCHTFYNNL